MDPITRESIIAQLADEGKMIRPQLVKRIDRALAIIAANVITRQADGTYLVPSSSRDNRTYTVNGVCDCADARGDHPTTAAPDGWCKHRLAVGLVKRADLIIAAHAQEQYELDQLAAAAAEEYEAARAALSAAMRRFNLARRDVRQAIAAATAGAPVPPAFCAACNGAMVPTGDDGLICSRCYTPINAAAARALRARTIPRLAAAVGRPAHAATVRKAA